MNSILVLAYMARRIFLCAQWVDAVQGQFPQVLVNQYSTDVPLTVNDVRKVVTAKLKAQAKQAAKACT